jgi:anthranilate phosphoribosyltransferase
MRHAAAVRRALGIRTIFNVLGPLINPSRPTRILPGVAERRLVEPVANALRQLGVHSALVVHGSGLDEVAVHDVTTVASLEADRLECCEMCPEDFGCRRYDLGELVCVDATESHRRARQVLEGNGSRAENAAVGVNVAMVLRLFGHHDLKENFERAQATLASGAAAALVARLADEGVTA